MHKYACLILNYHLELHGVFRTCLYDCANHPVCIVLHCFKSTTGLLRTVSDIEAEQINSSSIIVSFHAPPSLLGVPVKYYSITISSTDLLMNDSLITNSTTEILRLPNACIEYWITISAWNDVGQGDPSTFTVILAARKIISFTSVLNTHSNTIVL